MNGGAHIASFIVRALPNVAPYIAERICVLQGAEIHAIENGRIIVVLEGPSDRTLADSMDEIRCIDGVLAVSLVYHHAEPE
jgi:nitrate reductase NapD